jgi:hypothetical protein
MVRYLKLSLRRLWLGRYDERCVYNHDDRMNNRRLSMTGEELYEMYVEEMFKQNCVVDNWDDLNPEIDHPAWDGMAARLGEDTKRMDAIEEAASNGCFTTCIEMDGGVHVTIEGIGDEPEAYREQNSVRDGIDAIRRKAGLL